jgi:hypothetical protein
VPLGGLPPALEVGPEVGGDGHAAGGGGGALWEQRAVRADDA